MVSTPFVFVLVVYLVVIKLKEKGLNVIFLIIFYFSMFLSLKVLMG